MKTYITFGQGHTHRVNGHTLDKNTVAVINHTAEESGRDIAFELFDDKFHNEYSEKYWDEEKLSYFPKGYVVVR